MPFILHKGSVYAFVDMRWWVVLAVGSFVVLHQDFWFWTTATPLVFGFLPIGLFYHAVYSLGVTGLMWSLVRFAWPAHLEREEDGE